MTALPPLANATGVHDLSVAELPSEARSYLLSLHLCEQDVDETHLAACPPSWGDVRFGRALRTPLDLVTRDLCTCSSSRSVFCDPTLVSLRTIEKVLKEASALLAPSTVLELEEEFDRHQVDLLTPWLSHAQGVLASIRARTQEWMEQEAPLALELLAQCVAGGVEDELVALRHTRGGVGSGPPLVLADLAGADRFDPLATVVRAALTAPTERTPDESLFVPTGSWRASRTVLADQLLSDALDAHALPVSNKLALPGHLRPLISGSGWVRLDPSPGVIEVFDRLVADGMGPKKAAKVAQAL